MSVTDCVAIFLSIFLFGRGYMRGFLNSLIGPFSIIAATIISIIYYQQTKNMAISLAIGLAGPLLLHFILKSFLSAWATVKTPSFLSSLAGAALTLLWGWVFIFFTLILLAVLPPMGKIFTAVHKDVMNSGSYALVKPIRNVFFPVPPQETASTSGNVTTDADANTLAQDPRFQKILQDPEIQQEIKAHDFAKLMQNPKIMDLTRQLMTDPVALKKVMALYSSQLQKTSVPAS